MTISKYPGVHVLVEPLWLHYGESKDPGKMTHTGMACIERGLGAKEKVHNLTPTVDPAKY